MLLRAVKSELPSAGPAHRQFSKQSSESFPLPHLGAHLFVQINDKKTQTTNKKISLKPRGFTVLSVVPDRYRCILSFYFPHSWKYVGGIILERIENLDKSPVRNIGSFKEHKTNAPGELG